MQALEIQGIEMQALLIAMRLFLICGIQHALCFKNYCHYSAFISSVAPSWELKYKGVNHRSFIQRVSDG